MGGTASQPSPVQAGVKRARSPETQLPAGAGAGAAAAAAPPAKVARVDDGTPASASITKLEADCGITVNDLKAFIPAGGVPMKVRLTCALSLIPADWTPLTVGSCAGHLEAVHKEPAHGDRKDGIHGADETFHAAPRWTHFQEIGKSTLQL